MMKNFKKAMAGFLLLIMTMGMLTACGGDPVADDFEKFLNTDMVDVNANYEDMTAEAGKWDSFETTDEAVSSINDVLLPNIDDSLDKLSEIKPETDEVKELKDTYVKMLKAYKEGYEKLLAACEADDETIATEATEKIEEALKLLDDYNAGLESLAEEKGMKIEY